MGRLYATNSKSQTRALNVSLLFTQSIGMQLIICSGVLNQLQNQILRELVLSYGSQWFLLNFIYINDTIYKGWISIMYKCGIIFQCSLVYITLCFITYHIVFIQKYDICINKYFLFIVTIKIITLMIFLDILQTGIPLTLHSLCLPLVSALVLDTLICKYVVN